MAKNAHLVLDERATIEVRLRERALTGNETIRLADEEFRFRA